MHFAIIAAGEGSRLRQEGATLPKPLIPVMGEPMLGRLIALFGELGAESISVICNEQSPQVADYLARRSAECPSLHYVVQSTPSSMHSLAVLADIIPEGRFCLTTVDTVFRPSDFRAFIRAAETEQSDGLFAVTPFVDDEKPLWVGVQPTLAGCADDDGPKLMEASAGRPTQMKVSPICGFYDHEAEIPTNCQPMVSGGIYCLDTRSAFPILRQCLSQGQSRMRNYQRALIRAGLQINACVFPKIMDIDHMDDIRKAELWLTESSPSGLSALTQDSM